MEDGGSNSSKIAFSWPMIALTAAMIYMIQGIKYLLGRSCWLFFLLCE